MKLYHATYKDLIPSIKQYGLGGKSSDYRWEDSKIGVIYLAIDSDIAYSYAESNDEVPEDWLDEIVIFEIDSNNLDNSKLSIDKNVQDNDGSTYEYEGIIPFNKMKMLKSIEES